MLGARSRGRAEPVRAEAGSDARAVDASRRAPRVVALGEFARLGTVGPAPARSPAAVRVRPGEVGAAPPSAGGFAPDAASRTAGALSRCTPEAPARSTPAGRRALGAVPSLEVRGGLESPAGGRRWSRSTARVASSRPGAACRAVLRVRRRDVVGGRRCSPLRAGAVKWWRPGPSSGRACARASPAVADASHAPSRPATPHAPIGGGRCRHQAMGGGREHGVPRPREWTPGTRALDRVPRVRAAAPPSDSARGTSLHVQNRSPGPEALPRWRQGTRNRGPPRKRQAARDWSISASSFRPAPLGR